jgi:hypothetical protein
MRRHPVPRTPQSMYRNVHSSLLVTMLLMCAYQGNLIICGFCIIQEYFRAGELVQMSAARPVRAKHICGSSSEIEKRRRCIDMSTVSRAHCKAAPISCRNVCIAHEMLHFELFRHLVISASGLAASFANTSPSDWNRYCTVHVEST